jgi:hypothetical protein
MLGEWWYVGVVADPDFVAEYHFGSEAMVHHGGRHYASAAIYAETVLREGLIAVGAAVGVLVGHVRRSIPIVVAFVLLFIAWIVAGWAAHSG